MNQLSGTPASGLSSVGVCRRAGSLAWLIGLGAIVAAGTVRAVDEVTLDIAAMSGEGWQARNVSLSLGLPGEEIRASALLGEVRVDALSQPLRDVRIECLELQLSEQRIACPRARVTGQWPALGQQQLMASLIYGRVDGSVDVQMHGLRLGEGQAALQGRLDAGGWQASAELQQVSVAALLAIAAELAVPLPALSGDGVVELQLQAAGVGADVRTAQVTAQLGELTVNNDSGSLASDALGLQMHASVQRASAGWNFDATLGSSTGQAFAQPVFLDLGAHALNVQARGVWRDDGMLELAQFELDHAGVARGSGQALLEMAAEQPLRSLAFELASLEFPAAYTSYLQPMLLDTALKDLQSSGRLSARVRVEQGEPVELQAHLDALSLQDGAGQLSVGGLTGQWYWRAEQSAAQTGDVENEDAAAAQSLPVQVSHLHWQDGRVFGLELGASELHFTTQGRQARLLQAARIPLLDGAIELETFRVRNAGLPAMAFLVDATVQPISVQQLSRAFGWPEFGGQLGGEISRLRLRDGVISLGTTLKAQVFDGEVSISDLRLEQPFGQWPRLQASIGFEQLDLELLTSAFSFGRITGRLSGEVADLQLFNWTPVAFDARLYTPLNDRSRHRISQRAVENIGSMGGGGAGITAALSSGVLKFFDDFNYARLGVSCRLRNEVCEMDGIAPAGDGTYYLVKGRGLPRIDVIGSSRRVDWPRLVQQLMAVTQSGAPVVQ